MLNKLLNKKQQVVGWTMIMLISLVIVRTIFCLHKSPYLSIRIFLDLYFLIFIIGLITIYALRSNPADKAQAV
jgi:uncharacterized membrane protein